MAHSDDSLYKSLLDQAWDMWISPEIEQRRRTGQLPRDFALNAAQVIFAPDADEPAIRLNEEVAAVMRVKVEGPIEKGQAIYDDMVQDIESIELTDLDPDSGHVSIMHLRGQWYIAFDFRRHATRVSAMVARAREFLDVAAHALEMHAYGALIDNLFSAVELLAKAELLLFGQEIRGKRHGAVRAPFNLWGKLGNTDRGFPELLNRLAGLRPDARYLEKPLAIGESDCCSFLARAQRLHASVSAKIPPRHATANP